MADFFFNSRVILSGVFPVNGQIAINSEDRVYVDPSAGTFLRSGWIEPDPLVYPDASFLKVITGYSGDNYSVNGADGEPYGICWDGTKFWVAGRVSNEATRFSESWVEEAITIDLSAQTTSVTDIASNGTKLWALDADADTVYRYTIGDPTGSYDSVSFSLSSEMTTPRSFCIVGSEFYVCGDDSVYIYDLDGVYSGTSFSIANVAQNGSGIVYDGTFIWILGAGGKIYKYDTDGNYEGFSFDASDVAPAQTDLAWDGSSFYVLSFSDDKVYQFDTVTGTGIPEAVDPSTGMPIYLKVK